MSTQSCEPTLNVSTLSTGLPTRNHYFSGKAMSADDMILEQKYFIEKLKRMNSELSGYGIVNGLTIASFNSSNKSMEVNPGVAVDSHGNLLFLYTQQPMTLPDSLKDGDYIYLRFLEKGQQRVPREDDKDCGDSCCFNHISEETEIYLDQKLLTFKANDICRESKETKIQDKIAYLKRKSSFLLLGRYRKGKNNRGNIDGSERVVLHSNAELSKLLCDIEKHHVRSLNGKFGDLSAITTVNGKDPDKSGDFVIVAGNNISVSTEDNKVTISTKNGSHEEYFLTLKKKDEANKKQNKHEIAHNRHAFPTVDVYRRVEEKSYKMAYDIKELQAKARDMQVSVDDYMAHVKAKPLLGMYRTKKPVSRGVATTDKSPYLYSNTRTKSVLDKQGVKEYSSKVLKVLDKEIKYNAPNIFVVKNYNYEKIVGGQSSLAVKVTHLDNNRIEIENLDEKKENISLLVILNT